MCERMGSGRFFGEVVRSHAIGGLLLNETRYSAHSVLPRHCHEHAYFCLIRTGTYREEYGRRQRTCGPRMVAFHPAEEDHAEYFGSDEVRSFNVEFSPRCRLGADAQFTDPFESTNASIVGLTLRMYEEFASPDASSPLIIEGLVLQLLGAISRESRGEKIVPRWLLRVRDRVTDHCTDVLTLADLAQEAGVNSGYLATTFRRHFGCTVGAYARRQRVALACRHLTETDASLAAIALHTGFADQSHFARRFKNQVGLTPTAYRKVTKPVAFRSKS